MLTRIREKPYHIKQVIALVITVVVFSGIVFVWWSSRDARSQGAEVQSKTVSPLEGVSSMFDGLLSDFKKKVFGTSPSDSVATSTDFDLTAVVVIDPMATTTEATSTKSILDNTVLK